MLLLGKFVFWKSHNLFDSFQEIYENSSDGLLDIVQPRKQYKVTKTKAITIRMGGHYWRIVQIVMN